MGDDELPKTEYDEFVEEKLRQCEEVDNNMQNSDDLEKLKKKES